jgi:hypothetical protein
LNSHGSAGVHSANPRIMPSNKTMLGPRQFIARSYGKTMRRLPFANLSTGIHSNTMGRIESNTVVASPIEPLISWATVCRTNCQDGC